MRILLIEDEQSDVDLFLRAVRSTRLEMEVEVVAGVEEGMDYLLGKGLYESRRDYPFPDLVVLGWLLRQVSGVEFVKWCRATEVCKQVRLVVLTGAVEGEEVVQQALEQGANAVYFKPASLRELANIVREVYRGMEFEQRRAA